MRPRLKNKHRILEEFVAATGHHEKSAIRVLNTPPEPKRQQTRRRSTLYDEAARGALSVLWEASGRVCGKRLKAPLPILLPALERNGHLKLKMETRGKIVSKRRDDRSLAPDAEARNAHEKATKDRARAAAAHRMPQGGGISQCQRHATLRGAVRPILRSIDPQAVQSACPTRLSLAPGGSRTRRRHRAQNVSSVQRQTARPTSRCLQGSLGRNGSMP